MSRHGIRLGGHMFVCKTKALESFSESEKELIRKLNEEVDLVWRDTMRVWLTLKPTYCPQTYEVLSA